MSEHRLRCEELVKDYGGGFQLGPLSFALNEGVTCLVGPNGAEKSTLFRLAAGIEKPTTGTVTLETSKDRQLGYLPQEPDLPRSANCEEFLHYVAWVHKIPPKQRSEAVADALARVNLTERHRSKIRTLSGGMLRRLGPFSAGHPFGKIN